MGTVKSDRLREAREKAGIESAADAARKYGWPESGYRHHENGTRTFGPDAAKKYGRAFKVNPGWLLALEKVEKDPPPEAPEEDRLVVKGSVAAGVWRESAEWSDEGQFSIEDSPAPIPHAGRFGLLLEGRSMDEFYEPGTVLDCISIFKSGVQPQNGDHVIVERRRPDGLREWTVKEYLVENGQYFLVPRSSRPEFQARIEIGAPDKEHIGDDSVEVVAYVVAAIPPRALALMERMGRIKRTAS